MICSGARNAIANRKRRSADAGWEGCQTHSIIPAIVYGVRSIVGTPYSTVYDVSAGLLNAAGRGAAGAAALFLGNFSQYGIGTSDPPISHGRSLLDVSSISRTGKL